MGWGEISWWVCGWDQVDFWIGRKVGRHSQAAAGLGCPGKGKLRQGLAADLRAAIGAAGSRAKGRWMGEQGGYATRDGK